MRERNIYAADSMHVATASSTNADVMLVDDRHRDLFAEIKGRAKKF